MFIINCTCHVFASLAVRPKDGTVWSVGWLVSQSFQHLASEQDISSSIGQIAMKFGVDIRGS